MTRHLFRAAVALASAALVAATCVAPRAQAANKGPIKPGIPVTGRLLHSSDSDTWNLQARRGQFLSIEVDALPGSPLDPAVTLASESSGTIVAAGHSRTGLGHVTVSANCLPNSGTYDITVRSLQSRSRGRYQLTFSVRAVTPNAGVATQYCAYTDQLHDHTGDECSRAYVSVIGPGGQVNVAMGESKWVYIANTGDIQWTCQDAYNSDFEHAKCANGSNLVNIVRSTSGRYFDEFCYIRHFVS